MPDIVPPKPIATGNYNLATGSLGPRKNRPGDAGNIGEEIIPEGRQGDFVENPTGPGEVRPKPETDILLPVSIPASRYSIKKAAYADLDGTARCFVVSVILFKNQSFAFTLTTAIT